MWHNSVGMQRANRSRMKTHAPSSSSDILTLECVGPSIFQHCFARCMTELLLENIYKGGILKVPGCFEHTGVVTQLI